MKWEPLQPSSSWMEAISGFQLSQERDGLYVGVVTDACDTLADRYPGLTAKFLRLGMDGQWQSGINFESDRPLDQGPNYQPPEIRAAHSRWWDIKELKPTGSPQIEVVSAPYRDIPLARLAVIGFANKDLLRPKHRYDLYGYPGPGAYREAVESDTKTLAGYVAGELNSRGYRFSVLPLDTIIIPLNP